MSQDALFNAKSALDILRPYVQEMQPLPPRVVQNVGEGGHRFKFNQRLKVGTFNKNLLGQRNGEYHYKKPAAFMRVTIKDEKTGVSRTIDCPPIPTSTERLFKDFIECALHLNNTNFVKNLNNVDYSIHLGPKGCKFIGKLPPDEVIEAFLHRLRPIYLNDERTNFNRVANEVSRNIRDLQIAGFLRSLRKHYAGTESQETFKVEVAGIILNSESFFDNYINSFEYHRDTKRREQIDKVLEHFPIESLKANFVFLLTFRLSAIGKLANFLGIILARRGSLQLG